MRAKTICFCNFKGGVSKTTTALAVHALLPHSLGIGLDLQNNFASALQPLNEASYSIYDVLTDKCAVEDAISTAKEGDFIAASAKLMNLRDLPDETLRLKLTPVRNKYDYILLDLPPQCGDLSFNALAASDWVVIPVEADGYSLDGLDIFINVFNEIRAMTNPNLKIAGLLLTRYSGRAKVTLSVAEIMRESAFDWGTLVFKTPIRESRAVVNGAHLVRKSIFDYDPRSTVAQDYRNFVGELKEVIADDC